MGDLLKKYRNNKLSHDEFEKLREEVCSSTDEKLSNEIYDDWESFNNDEAGNDKERQERLYRNILLPYIIRANRRGRIWRWVCAAAAILLPFFIVSTVYFYISGQQEDEYLAEMSTDAKGKAVLMLPDGSSIELNRNSHLSYNISDFTKNRRNIKFSGEGYFDICKMEGSPFTIDTYAMIITVKGTEFNLRTNEDAEYAEISLIEGRVTVKSKINGDEIDLSPNNKAVLNFKSGKFLVSGIEDNDNPIAWRTMRLYFTKAPLPEVISRINQHFGCHIILPTDLKDEKFTGLVSLENLDDATAVIEHAFNTKITIK